MHKNPCWVIYLHPLTFIIPDGETKWNVSLDDINNNTYNHGELIRLVSTFSIRQTNLKGLICYDGAIAIPRNQHFPTREVAVDFFNNIVLRLLVKGLFVEGIDVKDVVEGNLYEKWCIWPVGLGYSAISQFHSKLRMRISNSIDSISLSNPRTITVSEITEMLWDGERILSLIPNLVPKFLTKGISEIYYKNWDAVLLNLWIIAEQIIDFLWFNRFLNNSYHQPKINIENRFSSLKNDSRTWSTAVKQEMLFQKGIISETILQGLSNARKSRNKLVHEGKSVERAVAVGLFSAIRELFNLIAQETLFPEIIDTAKPEEICRNNDKHFEEWDQISTLGLTIQKYRN